MKKRILSLLLAVVMATAVCCASAAAASNESAKTWFSSAFYVQGTRVCGADVGVGDGVQFLNYDGSIYIPLQTLAFWTGRDIKWDESSRTISIQTANTAPVINKCADAPRERRDVKAEVLPAASATVNGVKKDNTIVPIRYQKVVYLPLRGYSDWIDWEILYERGIDAGFVHEFVYFHEKISDADKEALKTYIQQASAVNERLQKHVEACLAETDAKKTIEIANAILKDADELAALARPNINALANQYATLDEGIAIVRENHQSLIAELNAGTDLVTAKRHNYILYYAEKSIRGDVEIDAMIHMIPSIYWGALSNKF